MSIFSNAFNFESYLHGGVDMRTGQYTCTLTLLSLYPEGPAESSRDIKIFYSMMSPTNEGYGKGWRLSSSAYDGFNQRLSLLSGETYIVRGLPSVGQAMVLPERKLKDVFLKRISDTTLHLIYKEGFIEVLSSASGSNQFILTEMIFENGESFKFNQQFIAGQFARLTSISNNQSGRELLRLHYNNSGMLVAYDVLKENGRYATSLLIYMNEGLERITIPAESPQGDVNNFFSIAYDFIDGLMVVRSFANPMGGMDILEYARIHPYGQDGAMLPAVIRITSHGGNVNAPQIQKEYTYSQTGTFTGFPAFDSNGGDSIFLQDPNYEYWTDEIYKKLGQVIKVTRKTYNRFHLMKSEVITMGVNTVSNAYVFNANLGIGIDQQPANFMLPKTITKTYTSGSQSRSEMQTIVTDDFGNQTSITEPSGVTTNFTYYPIAGESGKCPPEPNGLFQRFNANEKVLPASGVSPEKNTVFTYKDISSFDKAKRFVRLATKSYGNNAIKETYSYEESSAAVAIYGRAIQVATEVNGNGKVTTTKFTYQLTGDVLTETTQVLGFDGKFMTASKTVSVVNQLMLSQKKGDGAVIVFSYDVMGRLISKKISPNTSNQAVQIYTYNFVNKSIDIEDALGVKYRKKFDGLNRLISKSQVVGSTEKMIESFVYDEMGRIISKTMFDRLDGGKEISLITNYRYDNWGRAYEATLPDGSVAVNDYNPITRTQIKGINNSTRVRRVLNKFDKPATEDLLGTGTATLRIVSREFDGFGKCSSESNVFNHKTSYVYDGFDRITRETFTPAQGGSSRVQEFSFADHAVDPLLTKIVVDGKYVLGEQVFDGLGRLVDRYRGNGKASSKTSEQFTYRNDSLFPISKRLATGVVKSFEFNKELDAVTREYGSGFDERFELNNVTGFMAKGSTIDGAVREVQYDEFGRVKFESQTVNSQSSSSQYQHSPGGRLLSFSSALSATETRQYDSAGRFSRADIGSDNIVASYDAFGRLSSLSASSGASSMRSEVSYDAFGREAKRVTYQNNAVLQTQDFTYYDNGQIATRSLRDGSNKQIISETFLYDAYQRLITYDCKGPEYSRDRMGRPIKSQVFTYDPLNSITRAETTFDNGEIDVSARTFSTVDPTQLTRVTHTNPSKTLDLAYDAAGQLSSITNSGSSNSVNKYLYNNLGQLIELQSNGVVVSQYKYDATGRRITHSATGSALTFHYGSERLIGASSGSDKARFLRFEESTLARSISNLGTELYGTDQAQSVTVVKDARQAIKHVHYSPYGMSNIDDNNASESLLIRSRPAFNGESYDPIGEVYHLGNGNRAYSPELMIFLSPDSLSPFGEGGINSYAYCDGDPVNLRDPSGNYGMPLWAQWLLLAIGVGVLIVATVSTGGLAAVAALKGFAAVVFWTTVASTVAGVAAVVTATVDEFIDHDLSQAVYVLNLVALGLGLISFGSSIVRAGRVSRLANPRSRYTIYNYPDGVPTPTTAWGLLIKARIKDFLHEFVAWRRDSSPVWKWLTIASANFIDVGLTVFSIVSGFDDAFHDYPYGDGIYSPVVGEVNGIFSSLRDFEVEFYEGASEIRGSMI